MYLYKRNQTYYFRVRVPNEIQSFFESNEIKQSLKTKDYKNAKSLATVLYNKLQRFILMIKNKILVDIVIIDMANSYKTFKKNLVQTDLKNLPNPKGWIVEELDMYDDIIAEYKNAIYTKDTELIKEDLELYYKLRGVNKPNIEDKYMFELEEKIAKANIEVLQETKQEFKDGFYDHSSNEPITPLKTRSLKKPKNDTKDETKEPPKAEPKKTNHPIENITSNRSSNDQMNQLTSNRLKDKYEEWITHKEQVEKRSKSSIKDYRSAYRYIKLFFDENSDINSITSKNLKTMQKTMMLFPKNVLTAKIYKDLPLDELLKTIEQNELTNDIPYLTATRINGIFIHIKSFFDYLVYEEYLETNPVTVKSLPEEESTKTAFDLEDIKSLVNNVKLPEYIKDMCLVGLYTGMRIGEIVALEKENIITKNNQLFFDIVDGKTDNAPRVVPVHSKIKPIIEKLLKNKDNFLFNEGRYNATLKNVNYHLNKIIDDPNKTFHSFRKNFIQKLYETYSQNEPYIKVLVGHSNKANITYNIYAQQKLDDTTRINMVESVTYEI